MASISIGRDNVGQINIAENGSTINIISFTSGIDKFKEELGQFILEAKGENKKALEEARHAIDQKNEDKFKFALKKAASFISGVALKISASVLVEYMKRNGISHP